MPDQPGDRSEEPAREEPTAAEAGGFLPPRPPGPEPELGGAPDQPPPGEQQPPPPAWGQPPQQAWQQPPAQQPPPPAQQQPPNAGFPTGHQWPPPPGVPPAYTPAPFVPDNSQAVAGFVLSVVSGGLLVLSVGFSSIVSLIGSGLGIFFSLQGRRNVDEGRTPKHRDLAQIGFVTGIVGVVLAILAIVIWTLVIVLTAEAGSGGGTEPVVLSLE